MGPFPYVNISIKNYDKNEIYVTIDIVEKNEKEKLSIFVPNPIKNISEMDDLINQWIEYEKEGFEILQHNSEELSDKTCDFHHCLFGFKHSKLAPYEMIFKMKVKNKEINLLNVLLKDKDPSKRSAAAYLLGHIEDAKMLVHLLTPFIFDPNPLVRNSVMRIIDATIEKNNNLEIDINAVLKALRFPDLTDRNKALYILLTLSKNESLKKQVKQSAGPILIENLKMKQPNVHELAYLILKNISNQNFSAKNIQAWEKWVYSQD